MKLNTLSPAAGEKTKKHRRGRGIGSGLGKTSGRGHKGQKARAGGYHKVGFEGGQMPVQRRLPKTGFNSHLSRITAELRLGALETLDSAIEITLDVLKEHNLVSKNIKRVKIFKQGNITKAYNIKGLSITKGAREELLSLGGSVN